MVFQNCDNFKYITTIASSSSGEIIDAGLLGSIWYETDTEKLRCLIGLPTTIKDITIN